MLSVDECRLKPSGKGGGHIVNLIGVEDGGFGGTEKAAVLAVLLKLVELHFAFVHAVPAVEEGAIIDHFKIENIIQRKPVDLRALCAEQSVFLMPSKTQ